MTKPASTSKKPRKQHTPEFRNEALSNIVLKEPRCRFFRQPTGKTVLPVIMRRRLNAEIAPCVSCGLTQCLPVGRNDLNPSMGRVRRLIFR